MKNLILLIVLLSVNFNLFAQNNKQINTKYLSALLYLKTNNNINEEIRKFKKQWSKKEKSKKNTIEDFILLPYISYLPFPDINLDLKKLKLKDKQQHREKYHFDLERNTLFNELIPNTSDSKVCLLFSKPVDNYLIAEFIIKTTDDESDLVKFKTGPAMQLLFIFNENDIVTEVYISRGYYN